MSLHLKKIIRILLPLLVCIACLAISVGTYAVYGQHNLDPIFLRNSSSLNFSMKRAAFS